LTPAVPSAHPRGLSTEGLYGERAALYDRIYHWKEYDREAARLGDLLGAEGVLPGSRVVEAACGTGNHLVHLGHRFRVEGFDRAPGMLALARAKLPDVRLWQADMSAFELDEPADALLCLFSSIGYVHGLEALARTAACFHAALRPGGVLVVEPWIAPDAFRAGMPTVQTYEASDLKLARAVVSQQDGRLCRLAFHWLVARKDAADVEHFVEHHALWSATHEELLATFSDAGFACRLEPDGLMPGRGLLIGRRPRG
jgi:SAM-dependent methyltransferase